MKTVIEMAREVYGVHTEWTGAPLDRLTHFAELVRADAIATEREACAKVIEEAPCECCWPEGSMPITEDLAAAIRARSNT